MTDESHLSRIETMWSVVRRAHADRTIEVHAAQQQLLDRYGGAIRRYLMSALRNPDAADDVYQEFSLKFVRGDFHRADPERGRFRSFVKSVLVNLIIDHKRKRGKQMRERGLDAVNQDPGLRDEEFLDETFVHSWRDDMLQRCWQRLEQQDQTTGGRHFTVLRFRADHPDLRSDALADELTAVLGRDISAGNVRVLIHRARDAFAELMLEEISQSLESPTVDAIEEELVDLDLLDYCRPILDRRRDKEADSDGPAA